jgi:hypothetical protein
MKAKLLALLCLAAPAAFAAVSETPEELQTAGDLNGDSREDLVIVDKVTGVYRVGYGQANGSNYWVEARPSGIEHVTGLSPGRILSTTRDALAFVSPDANRVNVLEAGDPATAAQPVNVFISPLGPSRVIALDIGGIANTAHDDVLSVTTANSPPSPYQPALTRSVGGGSFSDLPLLPALTAEVAAADRVSLKAGGLVLAGTLARATPNYTFAAQAMTNGTPVILATANNLPASDSFLFASFNGTPLNQFLFYLGGGSNLTLRPVLEPAAGQFQFAPGTTFTFAGTLRQVVPVAGASDTRLVIIFGGGETAGVYSFDGTNAPALVESFAAEPGETFTGAAALGNGNLSLYSGTDGRSSRFQNWNRSGNGYTKGASGELPALNPLGNSGNVFLFANQPFIDPAPRLVGTLNASDWSSSLNFADPANVKANAEKFRSSTQGLGSPALKQLGAAPAGSVHGLPNQIRDSFSLLGLAPAIGSEVTEVKITPQPGRYPQGISVRLSVPAGTNALIFYRLGANDTWKFWVGQPFSVFKETTVSYYAFVQGKKSAIRSAAYSFDAPPSDLDSDGDGVPDFVELGMGGDDEAVHNKKDSDGDGHSDLAEMLAGSNPYNANSVPAGARPTELSSFTWLVTPRPLAAVVPGLAGCSNNTVVSAFDLQGGLLHSVPTIPWSHPFARFTNMFADASKRLYVAATEPHYNLWTNGLPFPAGVDTRIGRELLRLYPVPVFPSGLEVNYTYGGGSLATEAANWIAAAQAAQAALIQPTNQSTITHLDTLSALLTERKIGELLLTRNLIASTNRITLFPFRPQDAGRINPPYANLISIETNLLVAGSSAPDPANPGHKLTNLWQRIDQFVNSGGIPAARLRDLSADIYRISALSNNVAPGKFPSPVDTLRDFIESGVLHSNYLAASSMSGADLATAAGGVAQALAFVVARPTTNLVLKVRSDSFGNDCAILETLTGALKSLVLSDGSAFKFPEAFQLVPDSMVEVFAYTDQPAACGVPSLDVITLNVFAFPAVSPEDLNGNLLADAWECLYLINDPNGDADDDGVTNLQEFFDGTDPWNALSAGFPANLNPPQIQIQALQGGGLKLSWFWPEPYASKMKFEVLATDELSQAFATVPGGLQDMGGGNFQIVLPNGGTPTKFYRVQLSLK